MTQPNKKHSKEFDHMAATDNFREYLDGVGKYRIHKMPCICSDCKARRLTEKKSGEQ